MAAPIKATLSTEITEGLVTHKLKQKGIGVVLQWQEKAPMTAGEGIVDVEVAALVTKPSPQHGVQPESKPQASSPPPPKPAPAKKKTAKKTASSDFDPPSSDDE